MSKFSDKLKKPYFGLLFGNFFSPKNLAVTHTTTWASNTVRLRKKLMRKSKQNRRSDRHILIHLILPSTAKGPLNDKIFQKQLKHAIFGPFFDYFLVIFAQSSFFLKKSKHISQGP